MPTDVGIGSHIGGYTLESLLGRGGMSTVYIAQDAKLGRRVALKVMANELAENEAFRARFGREAQMAANLEHPNIVPVYDAGEIDGTLFLAMRVIRGTDLRRVINEGGAMESRRTVAILRQVAGALDAAHRAGLVHRDVKPANVLLAVDGEEEHAYLTDFGLTKHVSSKSGLTKTGQFMGTIDYVAPEQIRGTEVDGRTDVYSLGCVLYESLTGVPPFVKDQEVAILFAHLEDLPPKVTARRSDLPDGIDEVVAMAMSKERDDRFGTCMAVVQAARAALGLFHRQVPAVAPAASPSTLPPAVDPGLEPHPSFPPVDAPLVMGSPLESTPPTIVVSPATVVNSMSTSAPPVDTVPPVVIPDAPVEPLTPVDATAGPPSTVLPDAPAVPAGPVRTTRRAPTRSRRGPIAAVVAAVTVASVILAVALSGGGEEPAEENPPVQPPAPTATETAAPTASPDAEVAAPSRVRAPLNVRAPETSASSVTLLWGAGTGGADAVRFLVFRNGGDGLERIGRTEETRFVDDGVEPSTTYIYRIVAVGEDGSEARSKALRVVTPAPPSSSGGGGSEPCDGIELPNGDCIPSG